MGSELRSLRSRPCTLVLAAGLVGAVVSGCSQDTTRYSDDPFANPFHSRTSEAMNSVAPSSAAIDTQPLAGLPSQPDSATPPRSMAAAPAPPHTPQQASYDPVSTGSVAGPRAGGSGWSWDGGTAITVQPGETVDTIARRFGVPIWAIRQANNLADGRVQPGQRLVIPSHQSPSSGVAIGPTNAQPRADHVHVVNPGDTLYGLGRRYGVSHAEIARMNGLDAYAHLRIGQRLTIPGDGTALATARSVPPPSSRRAEAPAPPRVAETPPAPEKVAAVTPVEEPETMPSLGSSPQFRWPVRGRIISGFGPKPNGQHNDGINLAVPEGTEVKAAESGVVAYAGNELKGYGNLVLIRHADGWMTAYAHNSQLLVKRGDQVRRGQTIARSGQTGGVPSPQLHFEIRRGSTPVDPTQYLASL